MRSKLTFAMVLSAGLLVMGGMAYKASAHPPHGSGTTYYYGTGVHDYRPHWHSSITPFGRYSYFGLGAHDFVPHGHFIQTTPYYGGYNSRFASPYFPGSSYGYDFMAPYRGFYSYGYQGGCGW